MENTFFEICELDKKFDEIRIDINSGIYDDINWYNLESEMHEKLSNEFDSKRDFPYIEYLLEKRFVKIKKDVFSAVDINYVSLTILNEIVKNNKELTFRTELTNKEYCTDKNVKNLIDNSLRKLLAYNVLEKSTRENNTLYGLDLKSWFKQSKYNIYDYSVLEEIIPIVYGYIKTGNIKTFNIEQLFKRISEIIEFSIRPSSYHNKMMEIEERILTIIENNSANNEEVSLSIILDDGNNKEQLDILPIKIIFKLNDKYILCYVDKVLKVLPLYQIFINEEKRQIVNNINIENNTLLKSYDSFEDKNIDEKINVILECNTTMYEYFQMKPLESIITYATEEELKEFHQTMEYKPKDNRFYITASDKEDMILSTVLHCLPHAKILKPFELNNKLIQKFKDYGKDFIDICPPPTSNEPTSNSKNEPKNEEKNQSPKSSNHGSANDEVNKIIKDINDNML